MTTEQWSFTAAAKDAERKSGEFQTRVNRIIAAGQPAPHADNIASNEIDLEILHGTGKYARAADAGIFPNTDQVLTDGQAEYARQLQLPK